MNRAEMAIVAMVYAAVLLLGQRIAAAAGVPAAGEVAFGVAGLVGAVVAALLSARRAAPSARHASATGSASSASSVTSAGRAVSATGAGPGGRATGADRAGGGMMSFALLAAALLAALAVVSGAVMQQVWQVLPRPWVEIPAIAAATFVLPLATFPLVRLVGIGRRRTDALTTTTGAGSAGGTSGAGGAGGAGSVGGAGVTEVGIAAVVAFVLVAAAMIVPTPARFDVRLEPRELPGLTISLPPDWPAEEEAPPTFEYGSVKLLQPGRGGHFVSVRWTVSEPVQAEEYLRIVTAGGLAPRERSTVTVGGHEATSFYLESSDNRSLRAAATIWNCPDDRRVLWVFSNLAGSKSELLATHERIAQSARCHTGGARSAAQRVFPDFVPPSGFRRATTPGGGQLLFVGPRGEQIVFESAVAGRSELTRADVPPEAMGAMMRGLGLSTIVAAPTLRTAKDLSGHERRIWSAAGTSSRGTPLQVELMVWYCDARNMTFVGGYAAPDRHDPRDGVEALLPAACH